MHVISARKVTSDAGRIVPRLPMPPLLRPPLFAATCGDAAATAAAVCRQGGSL